MWGSEIDVSTRQFPSNGQSNQMHRSRSPASVSPRRAALTVFRPRVRGAAPCIKSQHYTLYYRSFQTSRPPNKPRACQKISTRCNRAACHFQASPFCLLFIRVVAQAGCKYTPSTSTPSRSAPTPTIPYVPVSASRHVT